MLLIGKQPQQSTNVTFTATLTTVCGSNSGCSTVTFMPLPGRRPGPVWLCEQQLDRIVKQVSRPFDSVESRQLPTALSAPVYSSLMGGRSFSMNFFTSTISCVTTETMSATRGQQGAAPPSSRTHLRTSVVNQTPVTLEGDIGRIDEGLHLLCRLVAKYKGDQRVGISVALQDMHVLVRAASRGLIIEGTGMHILLWIRPVNRIFFFSLL